MAQRAGTGEALRRGVVAQQAWGYSSRLVDAAELRRLVPTLEPGPVAAASFCDEEATVDPVAATKLLLEAAVSHGAVVRHPATVSSFDLNGAQVRGVRVGSDTIAVDAVVLATGVELPPLAAMLGLTVPMQDSPGLLAHTRPHGRLLDRVIVAPGATLKQLPNGEIVTGVDFGGSPSQDTSAAMGQRLLEGAGRLVPRLKEATLDRVTLGWRVLPADGNRLSAGCRRGRTSTWQRCTAGSPCRRRSGSWPRSNCSTRYRWICSYRIA